MDDDLIRCIQTPIDEKALERVLTRYDPLIRKAIRAQVWRSDLRDDVYLEVVLRMIEKFRTYRIDQPFEPWLHVVVRSTCVSFMNLNQQGNRYVLVPPGIINRLVETLLPNVNAAVKWNCKDIQEVWMSLQQSYPNRIEMLAFKWYCVDEMTLVDIAKKLQMPMRTVKDWTTSVANWLHPRMLEALQQRGWEFNEMQRLPPKLRPAVAYMKACQAAHKEAERKMCQNPERKKRQATLDAAKRKVKSLMPKQRTAEQRSEEEKWKGKRITPQADYLKKCQEALKAAEREVKYLTPMK